MKITITGQHSELSEVSRDQRVPWFRLSTGVVVGLVGVMSLASPESIFARTADSIPTIRVRVDNYAQASPAILAGAEREAGRILSEAGLTTIWLDCPMGHSTAVHQNACQEPLEATDIVLRVISESTQNKFQDTVFGFAVHPVLASVYYDYPVRLARSDNSEFELPVILGCVIAHEVGHLLLGSNSHSSWGIMQARWERKQVRQAMTGALLFMPEQAKHMQAEAQSRMKLQSASLKEQRGATVDQQAGPKAHSAE